MARKKRRKRNTRIKVPEQCYFCKNRIAPDYKDYKTLRSFVTDRAKILGSERTGICTKHQRRLTRAIKRARHLGLLPFAPSV